MLELDDLAKERERQRLIQLGAQAEQFKKSDAFRALIDDIQQHMLHMFMTTGPSEVEAREMTYAQGQLLDTFQARLDSMIDNGKQEERNRAHDNR